MKVRFCCVSHPDACCEVCQEKALEMAKEDLEGKPDAIKEKIVAGRPATVSAAW